MTYSIKIQEHRDGTFEITGTRAAMPIVLKGKKFSTRMEAIKQLIDTLQFEVSESELRFAR